MVIVEILYPGKVFHYECSQESAEWLCAQFKGKEWIDAKILRNDEDGKNPPESAVALKV